MKQPPKKEQSDTQGEKKGYPERFGPSNNRNISNNTRQTNSEYTNKGTPS